MRVQINGDSYTILGQVGDGEFCDVFYTQREEPKEMVVLKIPRGTETKSVDLLRREASVVCELANSSVKGSDYFSSFLPPFLTTVKIQRKSETTFANKYLWRTGFQYTFEDVFREYPRGVDERTALWMWKRALSFLGWLHLAGYVHSSCTPQHLLIHPRDHGLVLAGWSRTAKIGSRLVARSPGYEFYYPKDVWDGGSITPSTDIIMSARCVYRVLGGDEKGLPAGVSKGLETLITNVAQGKWSEDAWDLLVQVDTLAKNLYGGNRYHNFTMGGK